MDNLKIPGRMLGGNFLPKDASRDIWLSDHFRALAPPPEECDYSQGHYGMLGNNAVGDCVEVSGLVLTATWSRNAGRDFAPTTAMALGDYSAVTGFNPDDPQTDNGTDPDDYFKFWRDVGIAGGQHKLGAWAFVNPERQLQVQQTILNFMGCWCCWNLPAAVANQDVWDVRPGQALVGDWALSSWGNHAAPSVRYGIGDKIVGLFGGKPGLWVRSWNIDIFTTWRFAATYGDRFAALISPDQLNGQGKTPAGLDLLSLQAALTEVGQLPSEQ